MLRIDPSAIERLPAERREEARRLLAVYEERVRANPLLAYEPHRKQVVFHSSAEPLKAFLGGNRSGKTTAGICDDLIQAVDRDCLPESLVRFKRWEPPFFCRIIVPDFTSTLEGVIFQKLREWAPRGQLVGGGFDKAYDKARRRLYFENGSWFDFLTFEQDLDKFGGAALHRVHYDEEPPAAIRRESTMRLIDYGGDELFTMTPLQGMCVDAETEILTRHGWMRHDEIADGVPVLTYNAQTGATEWQPILAVHRERGYTGPMFRGKGHLDAVFTGDHRWACGDRVLPFSEMTTKHRVTVAAPHENVNVEVEQPLFHELVGWAMAEGSVLKGENKIVVYQSLSRYPENCERIEHVLRSLDAQWHAADRAYEPDGTIRRFVITGDVARQLRFVLDYPKRLPDRYVTRLGRLGLEALFSGLIRGDGHVTKTGSWHFTTIDQSLADTVQIVAVLLGWRSNRRSFQQRGKTIWRVTGSQRLEITDFKRRTEPCEPADFVWCPKTRNGTWIARRGGTAFITGNSWMYDVIWEPWTKGQLEEATVVLVDMDDNPHLDERTKRRALAGLSEEERQARKSGRFVHFAGMIYDEFSRNEHVVPEVSALPGDVRVFVGIDPGMRHMAAVVWVYLTADDRMVVFDELALQGHTVRQVAEAIHLTNRRWARQVGEKLIPLQPAWYVIDPAARNVVHQTGRSDQMEFTDHGIVTILGQNSVTAGINRVKERLESHRLVVAANCQTLIDQFRKYRWASPSRSESDPKEKPVKSDDHCLVAGTLVATEDGPKAIEDVRIGDRVWTRGGLCPVVAAGPTRVAPTRRLTCSDGSQIVGTDDHPIPVERDGRMIVTRMDAVRYGDILLSCRRPSSFKGSASGATPTPRTAPAASTSPPDRPTSSEASRRFTARPIRRITAPSPPDGTSTTPTGIRSTTTPPTSSACRHESTSASTGRPSEHRQPASTPPASGPRPRTGTPAPKDAPGTQSTAAPPGTASPSKRSASTAELSTSPGSPSASAPTTASPRPGELPAPTTSTARARHAGQSFASTAIPGLPTARVSALGTHAGPEAQTYNLTVYGHSEFFANGVLVLNCLDALRYVVMSRPAVPEMPESDERLPPLERAARRHQRGQQRRAIPKTPMGGIFI